MEKSASSPSVSSEPSTSADHVSAARAAAVPSSTAWYRKRKDEKQRRAEEMGLPTKSRKTRPHYICKLCGQPKTREYGHSRYKSQHYCSRAGGRSVEDWLEEKRAEEVAQVSDPMPRTAPDTLPTRLKKSESASSSSSSSPKPSTSFTHNPSSSSSSPEPSTSNAGNPPTRCTVYRRRMRSKKDRKVLSGVSAKPEQPLDICNFCGLTRRLDTGHAYYRGEFYCSQDEGSGTKSPEEWLDSQGGLTIPRTTLWRMKKAERGGGGGTEEGPKTPRKQHKVRICQRCGHYPLKDYGHSQLNLHRGKVSYCAMQDGISVDLWQARHRTREKEETKKELREGRLQGAGEGAGEGAAEGAAGGRVFKEEDTE